MLDVQQTVDRLPGPDEKLVATDLLVASGGPAANAAVTAAALGVSARLLTRIGTSPLGALIRSDLSAHDVGVVDRAGPNDQPAVSTVLVTRGTGQRAVVSVNATKHGAADPPTCRLERLSSSLGTRSTAPRGLPSMMMMRLSPVRTSGM